MSIVGRPFRLLVTGGGGPRPRQIVKTVPVDPRRAPLEQRCGALQAPGLHFLRAERGYSDFGHPDRQIGHRMNLVELLRPVMDRPQIPIEGKAVNGDHLHMIENPEASHPLYEARVERRSAAEAAWKTWALGVQRLG